MVVKRPLSQAEVQDLPTSLFLFTGSNPLRRAAVWFVRWIVFEWLIILTIIANCIVMALDEHLPNGDKTELALRLEELEPVFMSIFTVEMCVKILADGFLLHKGSYLRNPWNIMDFIVVVSGFLPYVIPTSEDGKSGPDLSTLRTFRVLRPLKLVSGVPSLQVVMSAIGKAIGPLVNIALLLLFAIIIFAIIGLEFYMGALNSTCYDLTDLDNVVADSDGGSPCHDGPEETAPIGSYTCNPNISVCLEKWEGPNNGITSFDNIGLAMLTVFQCVTMEGWTTIMYWTNDALGNVFNWVFFIPLIVVGSFFMLNLVLGVLSGEFAKEKERVESRAGFMQLKEQQKLEKELNGYVEWICKAEDLVLAEERTTEADRVLIMEARSRAVENLKKFSSQKNCSVETNSVDYDEGSRAKNEGNPRIWKTEKRFRFFIRRICKTSAWFWFVIVLVFLNTCTVAVEHYNEPEWLKEFLFMAEFVFLGAFIFEMGIRMYALGLTTYFSSSFNKFDCVVITGSVLEVFWVNFNERANNFGLSALRALRLLRVFKVTKYWSSLRNLVIALMNAISSILSLLFLLFLFIFIFALLGMQIFGGRFNFEEGTPTSNFNTITSALLTVFQILTGEDWNQVMYTAINSRGGRQGGGMVYGCYFVLLTLCGDYTLLNVFLAIACDSLDQAAALTEAEEAEKERQRIAAENLLNKDKQVEEEEKKDDEEEIDPIQAAELAFERAAEAAARAAAMEEQEIEEDSEVKPILPYSSFFILSSTNPLRVAIHWIVTKKIFDIFIMLVIILSSIALASEDPVDEDSPRNLFLGYADYGFTAIFTLECTLKVLDLGFVLHPGSYLRDFWNFMDITVVSCALISFYHTIAGTPTGQKLKSLKLLRVLRPLKTINRVPKLKAVFDCVVISLKNVFNIVIVYLLFQFIFAVVGVQLFNGKFFYCTDASKHNAKDCQGFFFQYQSSSQPPTVVERLWTRKSFHYDNCFMSMLTLFAVQTSEGWVAVLQDSMASTYEDEGPLPWFRVEMSIFYIVFFVVFPFFFVNIFVALIIVTFNELGEAELQDDMDKNQKSCIDFAIQAKPLELYVPSETTGFRYHMWRLVTSAPFENFILLLIILNTILLMLKFEGAPLFFTDILGNFNMVFTLLFTIECILKLTSFGPRNYFKDSWNTFDFITVVGSIIDATEMVSVGFLKLFRAARLIKLLRRSVSVRILLYTFFQSLKALPYVCMLMGMLFFIYAIVGMQLFGSVVIDPKTSIKRHNNFRHIFQSLMLLFRCATGEAWPDIMLDTDSGRPCDPLALELNKTTGELLDPNQNCGSSLTYVYFVSFIFLCSFIMLNLFVAVIMDNFDYLTRDSSILGSHHLGEFINTWSEFDPTGSGKIHYTNVFKMLTSIDPPLGFGKKCPERMAYKKLIRMNMPMDKEGKVNFTTTLFALIRENLKINVRESSEMDQADIELRTTIIKCWPNTKRDKIELLVPTPKTTGPGHLTVGKLYGGILIYENWKQTRFGQIEVLRQQEAELLAMEREEALNAAKEEAMKLGLPVPEDSTDLEKGLTSSDSAYIDREFHQSPGGMNHSADIRDYDQEAFGYHQATDWDEMAKWEKYKNKWERWPYSDTPISEYMDNFYGYDQRAMDNTRDSWALNSSNTVPQGFRGGRRLPPTPKTPSTLQPFMTSLGSSDYQSNQKGTIEQNNQRKNGDWQNCQRDNSTDPDLRSQPNLLSQMVIPMPSLFGGFRSTRSMEEEVNSFQTDFARTPLRQRSLDSSIGNRVDAGNDRTVHCPHNNAQVGNGFFSKPGLGDTSSQFQQHRKLPATPNKPSALFNPTASVALKSIPNHITKPSTLSFSPPFLYRDPSELAYPSRSNGSYTAFSFPKLNGSPSNKPSHFVGLNGFNSTNSSALTNGCSNILPHGRLGSSGSGFMGFGQAGFTTPIDTVLDRFGRTGTILPATPPLSANHVPKHAFCFQQIGGNIDKGFVHKSSQLAGSSVSHVRALQPVMYPFNQSNSLGRSLPPIPLGDCLSGSSSQKASVNLGTSFLARRMPYEDNNNEQRTDWI